MTVVHRHIGQLQYEGRCARNLADAGIFFYDHLYILLDNTHTKGRLQKIPLQADWNYIDWPIPDACILESVKSKLYKDVQRSLRGNIATRLVKVVVFMPITVFVELFNECKVTITKTMLSCKDQSPTFLVNLLDENWYRKVHNNIHCQIAFDTLKVKYMLATQSLIMSFWYKRSRYIAGDLVPMDQEAASLEHDAVTKIHVYDECSNLLTVISIRELCTLQQLRQDIIGECQQELPSQFLFSHNGRKVLLRRECNIVCKDLNNRICIIPQ